MKILFFMDFLCILASEFNIPIMITTSNALVLLGMLVVLGGSGIAASFIEEKDNKKGK